MSLEDREKLLDDCGHRRLPQEEPEPCVEWPLVETAIHTMRIVADNMENDKSLRERNWAQCNIHDLRREAEALEGLYRSPTKPE